jgi:hypothetical protein
VLVSHFKCGLRGGGGELDRIMVGLQILICVSLAIVYLCESSLKRYLDTENTKRECLCHATAKFTLASGKILAGVNGII